MASIILPGTSGEGQVRPVSETLRYEIIRDVPYIQRGDQQLLADVYLPKSVGPHPGVLMVHGGAWALGDKTNMHGHARFLAERDYVVVSIDYRLAPTHKFPAQIEDCKAAVRWMRRNAQDYKLVADRIAGYGYSAGGHLVCLLGTTDPSHGLGDLQVGEPAEDSRVQAVVAGGAPCDFRWLPKNNNQLAYWLGGAAGEKPELYRKASPARYVSADDPPVFLFHGEKDTLVPMDSALLMIDRLKNAGVTARMYVAKSKGHVGAFMDRRGRVEAVRFLDEVLKQGKPRDQ